MKYHWIDVRMWECLDEHFHAEVTLSEANDWDAPIIMLKRIYEIASPSEIATPALKVRDALVELAEWF